MPVTDSRENSVTKVSVIQELETVKSITWNIKLNPGNEEVPALLDSGSKANLISPAYIVQLPIKIIDTSWGLVNINKQQISTQGMVISGFEITNSRDRTHYLEKTFVIANILQPVVLGILFRKLGDLNVRWRAQNLQRRQ